MKYKFRVKHSPKELRQLKIDTLTQELKNAKSFLIFSSKEISHQEFEALRQKLTDSQATLRFIKNTLFRVAAQKLAFPKELYADEILFGPSAIIYIQTDDFIKAIKALNEQFGDNQEVKIKIAFLDQEIYGAAQVLEFAKIPSEQELKAKLVGMLNQPLASLHHALNYNLGGLVRGLAQIKSSQN